MTDAHSDRDRLASSARYATRHAIAHGTLPDPRCLQCTDCRARAYCYDHRDYTRPLDVEPVCAACNNRRKAGRPFPTAADGRAHKRLLSHRALNRQPSKPRVYELSPRCSNRPR